MSNLLILSDVSTTMILTPGPVIEFLKANQGAREARAIDWVKVKINNPALFSPFSLLPSLLLNCSLSKCYRPREC